jgi:phage tail-like protein
MSADKLRSYRFATEAQWNACLFVQADRDPRRVGGGIQPFAPYARPATLYESRGGHAPAVARTGEILWCDDRGALLRMSPCADAPETFAAPGAIAQASRIVSTASGLWVIGDSPESLQLYEEETLTRLLTIEFPNERVIDIATGGRGSVWTLIERDGIWLSVRVDPAGRVVETVEFNGISHAAAFVYLRRSKRFVLLADNRHPRLRWFSSNGGREFFSRVVAGLRPCFEGYAPSASDSCAELLGLGCDSSDRVFLSGQDGAQFGGGAYVVILDPDGNLLGDTPIDSLDAPVTGLVGSRDSLLVTGRRGLLRFNIAEVAPDDAKQATCMLITPALFSPDRADKRLWLRVEATANLPDGCALEISYASTGDLAERDRLNALAMDDSIPARQRAQRILSELDSRIVRTVFQGAAGAQAQAEKTFSAKLFNVNEPYLWVFITLTASTGARLPLLYELNVYYPGRTLMEDLPAIYQREEDRPGSFLRTLVGVLETTTQGLDRSIGSMGGQAHPSTAPEPWLDFIARWLGLPWDDELKLEQKQAILKKAAELAKGRGTRAGLETLLESLILGTPRRFRVMDATADFGFAVVGGESCGASVLPAMIGGSKRWNARLDSRAALGYMRLPCAGQSDNDDGLWRLTGKVRIYVAATAEERRAWEPWLLSLITEMIPMTARVELRWVPRQALCANRLGDALTLESAPTPHLGTDAITRLARLPERGTGLSASGPLIGTRLS